MFFVNDNQGATPFDTATLFPLPGKAPAIERETAQLCFDLLGFNADVDEKTEEHIAGSTGKRIEVKDHRPFSPRLMRVAA